MSRKVRKTSKPTIWEKLQPAHTKAIKTEKSSDDIIRTTLNAHKIKRKSNVQKHIHSDQKRGAQKISQLPRSPNALNSSLSNTQKAAKLEHPWKQNITKSNNEIIPDALGKWALNLKHKLTQYEFCKLVDSTRGRYELTYIPEEEHPTAPFLNHIRRHGAAVTLNAKPDAKRVSKQLKKGAHPSAHT